MIIDIFKDRGVFNRLKRYNGDIRYACRKFIFIPEGQEYDLEHDKVSYWFNPDYLKHLHISHNYPERTYSITSNPKFDLLIYFPNYTSIYLINLLYQDKKEVLIEDMAGGDGKLFLYLKGLGFTNFHITEQFTQLSKHMLEEMMSVSQVKYTLNQPNTSPIIVNLVAWTHITREDWPESIELACLYNRPGLVKEVDGKLFVDGVNHAVEMIDFVPLCSDEDMLLNSFCRKDKYEEFKIKLESRGIIIS